MAREIIEAIKAAEKKAAEDMASAKEQAGRILADERQNALTKYSRCVREAEKLAGEKAEEARKKAREAVEAAAKEAEAQRESLKAAAEQKKDEAVKAVISALFD